MRSSTRIAALVFAALTAFEPIAASAQTVGVWVGRSGYRWGGPYPVHYYHHRHVDVGPVIAAGLIGMTLGTIVAGSAYPPRHRVVRYVDVDDHVEWCLSRYRSYDPRSDTFVGRDGRRHRCR